MQLSGILYDAGGPLSSVTITFKATQTTQNGVILGASRGFTTNEDGTYSISLEPGYYNVFWSERGRRARLGTVTADDFTETSLPAALQAEPMPVDSSAVEDAILEALTQMQADLDASTAAREGAETAKVAAEAASDAAFVGADVYADITTGRGAVADGEQFMVVDDYEVVRYRRDSSTTQTELARYLASPAFQNEGAADAVPRAPVGQSHISESWLNPRLSQSIRDIYRRPNLAAEWAEKHKLRSAIVRAEAQAKINRSGVVLYCDPSATGAGDGSSWANAFTDMNDAFAAAAEGDTLRFNAGPATPFPGQSLDWGGATKRRLRIECDKGPDGMTVVDNRLSGTWNDEGGGVFSLAAAYNGDAAFDFRQDDETGTATGCDWTRPKYAAQRRRYKRTIEQVAAWYGVLREASADTTTPAEGEYSHSGGRYYIHPAGAPTLTEVDAKAVVPRNKHVLMTQMLEDCYWSGRMQLIFAPHSGGGSGYGLNLNAAGTTVADVETIMTGYHSVGFAGSSRRGNRMLNLTANGTISHKVSGTANAYVFFSQTDDTTEADCWAVGGFSVHYPCLEADGTPILNYGNYAPNHGLSHGGTNAFGGVRWSNCGQVDFCHQIKQKSGAGFVVNGSFVNGSGTGVAANVDDPNEWQTVCEHCDGLGEAITPSHATDHYHCIFDRDNLGPANPSNGGTIIASAGGSNSKQWRYRGGRLATGAGVYISSVSTGDNFLLEGTELVLEDGPFAVVGSSDQANPFLRMGGCVVCSRVKNVAFMNVASGVFADGAGSAFRDLGGNVFGAMGIIEARGGYPIISSYERDNQEWVDAVDPHYTTVIDAPLVHYSEGPELLDNGDFATGDLTGWQNPDGHWVYELTNGVPNAHCPSGVNASLYQDITDLEKGDLVRVRFTILGRGSASKVNVDMFDTGMESGATGFTKLASEQAPARDYDYILRVGSNWGSLRFLHPSSPSGGLRISAVSVKKLTLIEE